MIIKPKFPGTASLTVFVMALLCFQRQSTTKQAPDLVMSMQSDSNPVKRSNKPSLTHILPSTLHYSGQSQCSDSFTSTD